MEVRTYLEMNEHARHYMTDEEFICFNEIINGMPDGSGSIHGDCHAGNIMQQDGELLLIDMANAGHGHRILETESFIDRVRKYAKLKGLLLTLPNRDLAKAFESYLRRSSEELLADR